MPLNQQQIERQISRDLVRKYRRGLTFVQVEAALQAMNPGEKARMVALLSSDATVPLGRFIQRQVDDYLKGLALVEAQAMFADGVLNVTELDRWLG